MGIVFSNSLSCDTIITRCWDCAAGQAIYTCNLEDNLADLKTATDELKERRNDVMRKVDLSEQGNMKRLDLVQGWLSRSEDIIKEADQLLIDGPAETKNLCLSGCCSKNYKSTLKFSKRVAQKLIDVKDFHVKGAFDEVAAPVPAAPVVERPSDSAVGLESVLNQVWRKFEEEDVGIIGIYGKGGIGKTRLLTEINNKLIGDSSGGFDVVIWVVVSKGFDIGKVQDDIAKRIDLFGRTWNDKSPEEKATDIFRVLKEKKFVLLLDDIWERVDLSKVGIPFPTEENGSKLIFTTRSMEVCGEMRAHEKIDVKYLPEDKAFELFEEHVGKRFLDSHPEIRELAPEVAKECGGLPLALITIGHAMACKNTPEEWKDAINVLKRSLANFVFPKMGEEVYQLLKFSFDSLSNDMIRFCLLYCSLFPEDYEIGKEELIERWIGEGILDEYDSISEARNQGHRIIGSLIHTCLLEDVSKVENENSYVKMHDVIRDMSLWIASSCEAEKWKFYVQAAYGLTKVPEVGKWKYIRRMSLMKNKIENISEVPHCPYLQTLFLDENRQLEVIHNDFFQYMCGLKSLSLYKNKRITKLPVGISKLLSLEYLNLSETGICQLPIELKALQKLKCLNLEYINGYIVIPERLISAFSELQILRMYQSYPFGYDFNEHVNEYLFEEIQCLNHLNVFTVGFSSDSTFDRFLSAEKLHSCTEGIALRYLNRKQFNILSLANIKILKEIKFYNCERLEEVQIDREAEAQIQISVNPTEPYFQSLHKVIIFNCLKLRDLTWLSLASNLRSIAVFSCKEMEEIINERKLSQVVELMGTLNPFTRLEYVSLGSLPILKSIYWDALPSPNLKEIKIWRCPKLSRLPLKSNSAKGNKIRIIGEEKWWKELQWDDESTRNAYLSCFIAE